MLNYNLNFIIASTVFISLLILGLFNVLFVLRKRFPIKVNCWFCNTNLRVPYNDWNSFTCPKCQQYNGFDEDGNYNKEISEQHYSKLNTSHFCKKPTVAEQQFNRSNGFCEFCSRNQELKIHQLANFRPRIEANYDEEIEEFRQKLEDSYQLCHHCQSHLNRTLNKIKTKFIGSKISQLSGKLNKNVHKTAKIIIDDGRIISYFIISLILLLSIANFIRDMKIQLSSLENERISNMFNHLLVFLYTLLDIMSSWTREMKLNELFENIDKIALTALILNSLLIFNSLKNIKIPVIVSMLCWSLKMMVDEVTVEESYEMYVKGMMAFILIISSMLMYKEKKKEELDATLNGSFHKIPTEILDESDTELDLSETSSYFDQRSNKTVFSKSSRLNSSYRSSFTEPAKTLSNSTLRQNPTKPVDMLSKKSFSITKEVLAADRTQVQNDINRLKLSDKNDDIFSSSSTLKEFNSSQYSNPFSLERSRCDSPAPSIVSLFSTSTSKGHLISPPRLHSPLVYTSNTTPSWVAGGYWQSPQKKYMNGMMNQSKPVISRSSSQSSGLGTIDDSDKNSREEDSIIQDDVRSLFSDTTSHRRNLFEMRQPNRSLFSNSQLFNQPKHNNFFNNTHSSNNSFRNYRESNAFFK